MARASVASGTPSPGRSLLHDPTLDPGVGRFLERFFEWGAAPTVHGYADLFAADGTLSDAGREQPLEGPAIRTSMARVLSLVPGVG